MGDPRKLTKIYKKPKKLWGTTRITDEKTLRSQYGLKAARELWIAIEKLRRVRREARKLLALGEEERRRKEQLILNKLKRLNITAKSLDDVLSLTVRDFLERRLQTLVLRKNLAKTMKQARQLITHGYISVSGVRQLAPSRLLTTKEESEINYYKPINLGKLNMREEVKTTASEEKVESEEKNENDKEAKQ